MTLLADEVLDSEEVVIKKGMVFDTLEHLKYFLMDYAVRFHRPYYDSHSDKNKRYMVLYKNGCIGFINPGSPIVLLPYKKLGPADGVATTHAS